MKIDNVEGLIKDYGSPLYCYDEEKIQNRYKELNEAIIYPKKKIYYACKANTNIWLMKKLHEAGANIDAVSPIEVKLAYEAGYSAAQILYTGDSTSVEEMEFCLSEGILQNLGSLTQLRSYGELRRNTKVCIRINPDCGAGHHNHTITGGPKSKFGIYFDKIEEIKQLCKEYGLVVSGLHSHIGSGILKVEEFLKAVNIVLETALEFKELDFIDFGGGLGIPYKPEEEGLDVNEFGKELSKRFSEFVKGYGKELYMYLEPGRYIVGEAGVLLTRVTNIKETPSHKFVGTDTGFNHLIRPMAYGSYHKIRNYTNLGGKEEEVVITGNICESGDVFTQGREGIEGRHLSKVRVGDILGIEDVGAYGYSMSSQYNSRVRPAEVCFSKGGVRLIRRRESYEDLLRTMQV